MRPRLAHPALVDDDLCGCVLYKETATEGRIAFIIKGRLADGRHAGFRCDINARPLPDAKLQPVDPANKVYQGLVKATEKVRRAFPPEGPSGPAPRKPTPEDVVLDAMDKRPPPKKRRAKGERDANQSSLWTDPVR